jgi:hypothetical protein
MDSTPQKNKRLFFVTIGHFESNPDKITPGKFLIGTEEYDLPSPHIMYIDSESLKNTLCKVIDEYEALLRKEVEK